MKRNIYITIDSSNNNADYIHINNLEQIINDSCDSISFEYLEYFDEKDYKLIIGLLLKKLRPYGKCIISFQNAKSLAEKYINKNISNKDFLNFFINKKSIISLEDIYTNIDLQSYDIVDMNVSDNTIKIVIERKNYV